MTLAAYASTVSHTTALRASLGSRADVRTRCGRRVLLSSRCPPGASCPMDMPTVTFTPTVNGQLAVPSKYGSPPRYLVDPGERLGVKVAVTVPRHLTVTALWFGISIAILGGGRTASAACTILARYHQPLSAGSHTSGLAGVSRNAAQARASTSSLRGPVTPTCERRAGGRPAHIELAPRAG